MPPITCINQSWWIVPTKLLKTKKYIICYLSLAEIIMNMICTYEQRDVTVVYAFIALTFRFFVLCRPRTKYHSVKTLWNTMLFVLCFVVCFSLTHSHPNHIPGVKKKRQIPGHPRGRSNNNESGLAALLTDVRPCRRAEKTTK